MSTTLSPLFGMRLAGTVRGCDPEVTLNRIKPAMIEAGITRVANVTGLDCVGVPTWMVVRPLSRSLTVSQGKGLSHQLAKCSGIMESLEIYHAETHVPKTEILKLAECVNDSRFPTLTSLPLKPTGVIGEDFQIEWTPAKNLGCGSASFLPWELFDLDFTKPKRKDSLFFSSSNGLASGNSIDEALLHALCEVAERDQVTLWLLRRSCLVRQIPSKIDLNTVDDPEVISLLDACERAGLAVYLWSCIGDLKIPTFKCAVADRTGSTPFQQRAGGSGAHPIKSIAATRAITEALQSRLTHIAGSRDDAYWHDYEGNIPSNTSNASTSHDYYDSEESIDFGSIKSLSDSHEITTMLTSLINSLASRGLNNILWIDLTREKLNVPIVFLCVPGLEYSPPDEWFVPNERAIELLRTDS
jgi:ribosomal protein S12 methylthiotransferase accessory factor